MARKAKKRAPRKPVRRRRSRVEQEQRMRRYVIWATVGVGVLVIGLVGYGLVSEQVRTAIQNRQRVAVVNGTEITIGDLRTRAQFYESFQDSASPDLVDLVFDEIVEEELVRQEAERRGIEVSDAEVQDRIERMFDFHRTPPTPRPTLLPEPTTAASEAVAPTAEGTSVPTPTPKSEADFQRDYSEYIQSLNVTDEYFRRLIGIGSDLKWYAKGPLEDQFSVEFADEAFALETGMFSHTIESEYGSITYYVVEVVAHEERELDEASHLQLARRAFNEWLEEQMASVERLEFDRSILVPGSEGNEVNPLGQ
jgi:parvulin-like peptidyl-prolyl isomerase